MSVTPSNTSPSLRSSCKVASTSLVEFCDITMSEAVRKRPESTVGGFSDAPDNVLDVISEAATVGTVRLRDTGDDDEDDDEEEDEEESLFVNCLLSGSFVIPH